MLVRHLRYVAKCQRFQIGSAVRCMSTDNKVGETSAGKAMQAATSSLMDLSVTDIHHKANIALTVALPTAFILSPSFLAYPFDLALGVTIPVHSHICLNLVAEDYVPRGTPRSAAKLLIGVVTFITAFGLLKVNLCGPGITESVKSLWRAPAKKE
eukprot:CAMPEP_0170167052 /NCGR_PEP_ID=MMETSP0040_2-20121228/565_1 /TAXON_ID=641309 /ORGANISM="Lotharella oceanica, Strain CCMP622" /LENGTH=154 /DNA_ID=CAMNT_0010404955 /DNA_START=43 /DNA_END=507 /DNA_ORIENTATION=+